jgi:hypothetical protein
MIWNSFIVSLAALLLVPADNDQKSKTAPGPGHPGKFSFVRVVYDSTGGADEAYYFFEGRMWYRWETDYPEAEENFLKRLAELTTIQVNPEPKALRLDDPEIQKYPFIYMCDVGWQQLERQEEKALRDYLKRGGFLWVDDFWGDGEWQNFELNMRGVFPDLEWQKIPNTHPILQMVFPLDECPQIPAKSFWDAGWRETFDHPRVHRYPHGGIEGVNKVNFKGLFDEETGRLMAVATHNNDVGDGWEREGENIDYFKTFSTKSYAIGINIIVYALTH